MDLRFHSPEERAAAIERARRLQQHGPDPAGPMGGTAPAGPLNPPSDDSYTADDLFASSPARRKRMPNGRWLWVHPLGLEQVVWLNGQATRHLNRLQFGASDPAKPVAYKVLAWVYQVIACCRVGPEPDAAPVFTVEHADALYRNPQPGSECIQQIVALCDELGQPGDTEALSELQADFFGVIASWLGISASRLSTDSLESWQGALREFAEFAWHIKQRGTLSKSDLQALPPLPEGPEPPAGE